jgi:glycosyltransferase involved in cell wall biosynthesis
LKQTHHNLEIILVNDGSTDASGMICDEYATKDGRIKVIHKKNGGASSARNTGLLSASGDFIGFVDSDDFIEPIMYEMMLKAIKDYDADIAACNYQRLDELDKDASGEERLSANLKDSIQVFTHIEALEIFVCDEKKYGVQIPPGVVIKLFTREVISGIEFPLVKTAEEFMYVLRALCRSNRIVHINECYYKYFINESSLMHQRIYADQLDNDAPIMREQIDYLRAQGLEELANKAVYHYYRAMLVFYVDFKLAKEKMLAGRVVTMLRANLHEIKTIYRHPWVNPYDRLRMLIFLSIPCLYYYIVAVRRKQKNR